MSCRVFMRTARSDLLGARFGAPSFQSRIVSAALSRLCGFAIRRVGRSRALYFIMPLVPVSGIGIISLEVDMSTHDILVLISACSSVIVFILVSYSFFNKKR